MWPFTEMSLQSASTVATFANWGLLIAIIGSFVSTFVIVQTTDVKEEHWAKDRQKSAERVAANETETKRAIAESDKANATLVVARSEIAIANAKIAEAGARAKEAELRLEQLRERMRGRHIKGEQFLKILEGKPKAPVEVLFVNDGEAFELALEIRSWLRRANWDVTEPRQISSEDMKPHLANTVPSTMAAGGQPQGVSVFLRAESDADISREFGSFGSTDGANTPRRWLSEALGDSLGSISGGMSGDVGVPGVLRVIVGPKPGLN